MDFPQLDTTSSATPPHLEITSSKTPQRFPSNGPQHPRAARPRRVAPEQLRLALEDLQRVAENAIACAVDTDLNLAIRQTAQTIDDFTQAQPWGARQQHGPQQHGRQPNASQQNTSLQHDSQQHGSQQHASQQHGSQQSTLQQHGSQQNECQQDHAANRSFAAPILASSDLHGCAVHNVLTFAPATASARKSLDAVWKNTGAALTRTREIALRFTHTARRWRVNFTNTGILSRRDVSVAIVLLFAVSLLIISKHGMRTGGLAVPAHGVAATTYNADPEDTADAQVLTVPIRPDQTLKELSLLYLGRYDGDTLARIRALNPELPQLSELSQLPSAPAVPGATAAPEIKDANRIGAGQLLRLPLPHGTLKKVMDTSDTTSAPKANSDGMLYRLAALWNGTN